MGALTEVMRKALGRTSAANLQYSINRLNESELAFRDDERWQFSDFSKDFLAKKSSETLFVLGSGPSINNLSAENFREISDHDSLGFNSWFFHDFVPRFYLFRHCPKQPDWEIARRLLQQRVKDYSGVEILLQGSRWSKCRSELLASIKTLFPEKSFWYIRDVPVHSRARSSPDENSMSEIMSFFGHLGLLDFGRPARVLPQFGGTLGILLPFAIQLGYRNVVLCGFDGKSLSHFYDVASKVQEIRRLTGLKPYELARSKGTYLDPVTLKTNSLLVSYVQDNTPCRLWTGSGDSVFSGLIPSWSW